MTHYGLDNRLAPNLQNDGYFGHQSTTPASGAATSAASTPASTCIDNVKKLLQQANEQLGILDKYVSPDQLEEIVRQRVEAEAAAISGEYQKNNEALQKVVRKLQADLQQAQQHRSEDTQLSREVGSLRQQVERTTHEKDQLDKERRELRDNLRKTQEELNSTKTRLSEMMSGRLTDNNPNIADLSDMNRPTKLGERYNELYDNQWTEAFEFIEKYRDEKETIKVLKNILFETNKYCVELAKTQMKQIQDRMFFSKTWESSVTTDHINKILKDGRKVAAALVANDLFKKYMSDMRQKTTGYTLTSQELEPFLKECFEICWLMAVQDPPVVLGKDATFLDTFDTNLYKAYTHSGSKVEFLVWPPMYLSKDGAVLTKGVAQGYQSEPRRTKSAAPRRSTSPEAVSTTATKEPGPVAKTSFSRTTYDTRGNTRPADSRADLHQALNYQQEIVYPTSQVQAPPAVHHMPTYTCKPNSDDMKWFYYYEKQYGEGKAERYLGKDMYNACVEYVRANYGYGVNYKR